MMPFVGDLFNVTRMVADVDPRGPIAEPVVPPVTVRVAVYCPVGQKRTAEFNEAVTLLGLPGLAVPLVRDRLSQFAHEAEL